MTITTTANEIVNFDNVTHLRIEDGDSDKLAKLWAYFSVADGLSGQHCLLLALGQRSDLEELMHSVADAQAVGLAQLDLRDSHFEQEEQINAARLPS